MDEMDFAESVVLSESLPEALPPLAVDIDGTLTDDRRALDPRVVPVLRNWPSPLCIATGKALPYPVGLCEFLGIETRVIAENGGVVVTDHDSEIRYLADPDAASTVATAYRDSGHELGWGAANLVNRWRETELAVSRDSPLEPLEEIAAANGLTVVDTGYAYHVHSEAVTKGVALKELAVELGYEPSTWAFIGDSPNDVPGFDRSGLAVAVGNAPEEVKSAADHVTDRSYGSGFLEGITWLCEQA